MVFEIREKKKKKKYRRNGEKKENVRRSASRTRTTVIRRFPEPARQPLGPSKTQRRSVLILKKRSLFPTNEYPPTQAFLGELVFGEGWKTSSPKNACVGG